MLARTCERSGDFPTNGRATLKDAEQAQHEGDAAGDFPTNGRATLKDAGGPGHRRLVAVISRPMVGLR